MIHTTQDSTRHSLRSILTACLLLISTALTAQADENQWVTPVLTFHMGHSLSMKVIDRDIVVDTIAGRLRLRLSDIMAASVTDAGDKFLLALRNGERWTVDVGRFINLLDNSLTATIEARGQTLHSISFSGDYRRQAPMCHSYKLLLNDHSTAIIDPASVLLPVVLQSGHAELPLGAVYALKFAIPEKQKIPGTIYLSLHSGHIYQLPWAGRTKNFSCKSVSGNQLKVAFSDVIGLIPVYSEFSRSDSTTAYEVEVVKVDEKPETGTVPLQVWTFKTDFGHLSLPSPLVASFTVPANWREKGEIRTIYGDLFKGKPDFKSVVIEQEKTLQTIALKSFKRIERTVKNRTVTAPYPAPVISLTHGGSLMGTPYAPDIIIETMTGEAIVPEYGSTISRSSQGDFVFSTDADNTIPCRPVESKVPVCLTVNGQRVTIDWTRIVNITFNSPPQLHPNETDDMEPVTQNDGQATSNGIPNLKQILTAKDAIPDTPADRNLSNTKPGEHAAKKRSPFAWFRNGPHSKRDHENSTALVLDMQWAEITLNTNQIKRIYLQDGRHGNVVITTSGDVLIVKAKEAAEAIEQFPDRVQTATSEPTFQLPPFQPHENGAVRIRMQQGDVISGILAQDEIPFAPKDKSDSRSYLQASTTGLKRIMRTGAGEFLYDTDRGHLTGKLTRDHIELIHAGCEIPLKIQLRNIESMVFGNVMLPPPITHAAGRPPALEGLVYLPGGTFSQGSGQTGMSDELPVITVTLSPFLLDATEITVAQFEAFVEDSGHETTAEQTGSAITWKNPGFVQQPDDPVVCVSWADAAEFCNWRSRQVSLRPAYVIDRDGTITTDRQADGYRLPTESEWEFAAGGLRMTTYPWGNALPPTGALPANFMQREGQRDDGWRWTNPVHAFPPDANGIYGMAGNVWEWCEDWYVEGAYAALRNRSPLNPSIGKHDFPNTTHRVMRGGSYRNALDLLRAASRGNGLQQAFASHVGFRCARQAK